MGLIFYTKPVKPRKASDNKPATSKFMGTPCRPFGMLASSKCSRILANSINARPKPNEFEIAKNTAFNKLLLRMVYDNC